MTKVTNPMVIPTPDDMISPLIDSNVIPKGDKIKFVKKYWPKICLSVKNHFDLKDFQGNLQKVDCSQNIHI